MSVSMNKYTRRRRIYALWIGANSLYDGLFITNVNNKRGDLERFSNESELLYIKKYNQVKDLDMNLIPAYQSVTAQRMDRIEASDGLRIEFDVTRSVYGGAGRMTLKIYNLSPNHRKMLFQDYFAPKNNPPMVRSIVLSAGFEGEGMGLVFTGQTMFCCSYKQGHDFITEIQAMDGGLLISNYDFGHLSTVINSDMTREVLLKDIVCRRLKQIGIDVGKISLGKDGGDVVKHGTVLNENALSVAKKYAGKDEDGKERNVFIDLNKFYIMSDREALAKPSLERFDSSMILGTPRIAYATLTFSCVFEAKLKIGQILKVDVSGTGITVNESLGGIYSGKYKIIGLHHSGGISDSTPSTLVTTVELATRDSFLVGMNNG